MTGALKKRKESRENPIGSAKNLAVKDMDILFEIALKDSEETQPEIEVEESLAYE